MVVKPEYAVGILGVCGAEEVEGGGAGVSPAGYAPRDKRVLRGKRGGKVSKSLVSLTHL